ncbi:MAG: UDP-N-acetylglucosamine 1-carboxyvinyltransferase [Bacilli bacterium]|nr:UDP-N-acetylglucosamine 1-carboxyvinyltransferase [Bacilli bacterium]MDD4808643.1 UDP-N-acetylglucosamine 1-carboxyvinyltransferase [Bacilli bacterium]
MKQIRISGGHVLEGTIRISGAKNSAVALVPASLLSDEIVKLDNVPNISDIDALNEILTFLGAKVKRNGELMEIDSSEVENKGIPEHISKKLRASYYFMGALLGKYKKVEMYFPGGCSIGSRPINLHLKGFEALGATVIEEGNKYTIYAEELKGSHIYLDMASVGATINIMLAAVKATGLTIIENAAKEPEIVNVATFLNQMGAKITGAGTSEIKITGVDKLGSCYMEVIPDRIETGTYVIAGALRGKNLKIDNIIPEHIEALLIKLKEMGVKLDVYEDHLMISATDNLKPVNITTQVYPGFATDLQQPITTLLTMTNGTCQLEETIYENRFQNVEYLNKMGADITIKDQSIVIVGPSKLRGTTVKATDLRAGACLILAGLIAEGETVIEEVEHVLRGYENIIEKLTDVGAKIKLEEI